MNNERPSNKHSASELRAETERLSEMVHTGAINWETATEALESMEKKIEEMIAAEEDKETELARLEATITISGKSVDYREFKAILDGLKSDARTMATVRAELQEIVRFLKENLDK